MLYTGRGNRAKFVTERSNGESGVHHSYAHKACRNCLVPGANSCETLIGYPLDPTHSCLSILSFGFVVDLHIEGTTVPLPLQATLCTCRSFA